MVLPWKWIVLPLAILDLCAGSHGQRVIWRAHDLLRKIGGITCKRPGGKERGW